MKLAILTTHPIQYQVPWFRALARVPGIDLTVFFCLLPDAQQQGDGFGVAFEWDVPLLEGYNYRVLENVANVPSLSTFWGCDTPGIAAIVRDEGFDAFIVNGWVAKSCLQLLVACRRHGVPCIVRGESNDLRPRVWWKRVLHRLLLRQYAACLYIGKGNRRFYLSNGVPEEKLFFAPYCVEGERFAAAAEALRPRRDQLRAGWGIPAGATVFLFCGKFIGKKRPMDVLKALETVRGEASGVRRETSEALETVRGEASGDSLTPYASPLTASGVASLTPYDSRLTGSVIHLLMVGTGELLEECREYAQEHGLPVTFAGFLNQGEIGRAYAAADCLVLPSDDGETWGLVVNEAMACGLPALVSDRVGCHLDLMIPGVTGEVFPLGDTALLGRLMAGLAEEPERLATMGTAARHLVDGYSYDEVVRGTRAALDSLGRAGKVGSA